MTAAVKSPQSRPAQPTYILRGHAAQIHAVHFCRNNLRLLSGDADGWVVVWNLPIRRPVVVWKPHNAPVLGVKSWGHDRIITHGRDNKLHVWQLKGEDESSYSNTLPIDDTTSERRQPWLLHSLDVNALNFCSFAMCEAPVSAIPSASDLTTVSPASILVAVPGLQDGHINVTSLPAEDRIATIPSLPDTKTGMVMTIGVCHYKGQLTVLAGYESGHAAVWQRHEPSKKWQLMYINKSHTQPILSLDVMPESGQFFTSSADAVIASHPIGTDSACQARTTQTKHAGQQSITLRSDGRIFATAGWDGRARVYSSKTLQELAVLKWHKQGCYAVAFAEVGPFSDSEPANDVALESPQHQRTVSERRTENAKTTHLLAAGSKDGKISLWDVY